MSAQGADRQRAVGERKVTQAPYVFNVDQAFVLYQPFFHRQEQLGPPRVNFSALAEATEQLGNFRHTPRFFQAKSSKHAMSLPLIAASPPGQTHRALGRLCA